MDIKIRLAGTGDVPQLLKIYEQYIDTPITFEYTLPTILDFTKRILSITKDYPYLVCEKQGRLVGYAYAHRHIEREAYQWNAERSIYLSRSYTSQGIGKRLYCALIELLEKQGVKNVYGGVTLPNVKSEKLHLGLGFSCLGVYRRTGFKCGQWHDVAWFGKEIGPYTQEPTPLKSIGDLSLEYLNMILQKYSSVDSE